MKLWVFGAAAVVAVVLILRRRSGSSGGIERLAQAIAAAEGYGVAGAIPTVRNNPGDLKLDGKTITTFKTPAEGWAALYRQLEKIRDGGSAFYSVKTTIRQMGQKWTATASEQLAWSRTVANKLGVALDTPLEAVL